MAARGAAMPDGQLEEACNSISERTPSEPENYYNGLTQDSFFYSQRLPADHETQQNPPTQNGNTQDSLCLSQKYPTGHETQQNPPTQTGLTQDSFFYSQRQPTDQESQQTPSGTLPYTFASMEDMNTEYTRENKRQQYIKTNNRYISLQQVQQSNERQIHMARLDSNHDMEDDNEDHQTPNSTRPPTPDNPKRNKRPANELSPRTTGKNNKRGKNQFRKMNADETYTKIYRDEEGNQIPPYARFARMTSTDDKNIKKLSPFAIRKAINHICGQVKNVVRSKKDDDPTLTIETYGPEQLERLLLTKSILNDSYSIKTELALNYDCCQGLIYARDLRDMGEEELLRDLKEDNNLITQIRRITKSTEIQNENANQPRDDTNSTKYKTTNTGLIIVTFGGKILPEKIIAGYESYPVRPYIPRPMRCMKCQRFGHTQKKCRSTNPKCGKCAEEHQTYECKSTIIKCTNCNGNHLAKEKTCPKFILENEINALKHTKNISFQEARNIVTQNRPDLMQSYANTTEQNQNTETPKCAGNCKENNGINVSMFLQFIQLWETIKNTSDPQEQIKKLEALPPQTTLNPNSLTTLLNLNV